MGMKKEASREPRHCLHCDAEYQPVGNSQKYCLDCLGPAKRTAYGIRYVGANRLRLYGINHAQWLFLLSRYSGLCWICKEVEATEADHCHETGKVRGALCKDCNVALHYVERDGWLDAAHGYLKEDR